jgi:hypothetical protein
MTNNGDCNEFVSDLQSYTVLLVWLVEQKLDKGNKKTRQRNKIPTVSTQITGPANAPSIDAVRVLTLLKQHTIWETIWEQYETSRQAHTLVNIALDHAGINADLAINKLDLSTV